MNALRRTVTFALLCFAMPAHANDLCDKLAGATPSAPVAVLVDADGKPRPGPLDVGTMTLDAAVARGDRPVETAWRIVVAPLSAQPDSVPGGRHAVQVVPAAELCAGARTYRVVVAWSIPADDPLRTRAAPEPFDDELPHFTFEARDEHDHGSRALYRFDDRVAGSVALQP